MIFFPAPQSKVISEAWEVPLRFNDPRGRRDGPAPLMGCYGIGVSRFYPGRRGRQHHGPLSGKKSAGHCQSPPSSECCDRPCPGVRVQLALAEQLYAGRVGGSAGIEVLLK